MNPDPPAPQRLTARELAAQLQELAVAALHLAKALPRRGTPPALAGGGLARLYGEVRG